MKKIKVVSPSKVQSKYEFLIRKIYSSCFSGVKENQFVLNGFLNFLMGFNQVWKQFVGWVGEGMGG